MYIYIYIASAIYERVSAVRDLHQLVVAPGEDEGAVGLAAGHEVACAYYSIA